MAVAQRGRPRDPEADARILRAGLAQLLAHGYTGFSVDKVAEQAGVAKTTLYRRWPTKDHLAIAVIGRMQDDVPVPDTGDIRADLTAYLEEIADGLDRMRRAGRPDGADDRSAGVVAELVAAAARHPDIGTLVRDLFTRRNRLVLTLIENARLRGALHPATDPTLLFDQLAGALYYRTLITGLPTTRPYPANLVTAALQGTLPTP